MGDSRPADGPCEGPVLILAGPTGSGKSALAIDAALALNGVVINADSMQVYRELRVLTARPSEDDERLVPHRLFGVLSAGERCSAGRWLSLAAAEITAARQAGRMPIVCGGTGLYLKALTSGLSTLPEIPDPVRRLIRARYRDLDGAALHGVLQARDPEAAARLGPTDVQRLTRALEVIEATGRPLAAWHAQCPPQPALAARAVTIVLLPPRQELYPRLDARFERMIAGGAIDEVRALLAHGRDPDLPAMKAVGVRQLASHLKGGFGLTEACRLAKQATRQYAKRQMTWIRTQMRPDRVWPALYGRDQKSLLRQMIRELMLTPGA